MLNTGFSIHKLYDKEIDLRKLLIGNTLSLLICFRLPRFHAKRDAWHLACLNLQNIYIVSPHISVVFDINNLKCHPKFTSSL